MSPTTIKERSARSPQRNGVAPVTVEMETITPDIAGDWLERNTHNRRLDSNWTKNLAERITRGEWNASNGETFKIDRNGVMLDGQHRCAAVVIADCAIQALVARNVDPEAFTTIDIGRRRTLKDSLYLRGENNTNQLAATLQMLWRWRTTNKFLKLGLQIAPTPTQLLKLLEDEPDVRASIAVADRVRDRVAGATISVMACLHYILSEIDSKSAADFFTRLERGSGLEDDDPIFRLRERLNSPLRTNRLRVEEVGALTIKAWNAYRDGRPMKMLSWKHQSASPELYPQPY